ncbi:MAG: hypothetical protein J0H14_13840 [Alphaproteobacteria bacterium]|nr:hypothetical protein [Alphaproteobacteria bacterium]
MSVSLDSVAPDRLTRAVLNRQPFIALIGEDEEAIAAVLDAASVALQGRRVRIVRPAAGPATALTVDEVIRALGGDEQTEDEGAAERVLLALTRRRGDEDQVVLVVERAETLQPRVLSFLRLLPAVHTPDSPALQVLFAGGPDFGALLDQEPFRALRDQIGSSVVTISSAEEPGMEPAGGDPPADQAMLGRRVAVVLLALVVALVGLGWAGYDFFYRAIPYEFEVVPRPTAQDHPAPTAAAAHASAATGHGDQPPTVVAAAPSPAAAPSSSAPASGAPTSAIPASDDTSIAVPVGQMANAASGPATSTQSAPANTAASTPPADDRERLRREFDAFLDQSTAARLTEAQRELLFEQYLAQRHAPVSVAAAVTPAATAHTGTAAGHVVIHYPTGSGWGAAEADRLRTMLGPHADQVETRAGSRDVREPVIRYFFVEDAAAAKAVAADLKATGADWHVQDSTTDRPRPSPGTVEVWLPEPE